MSKKSTRKEPLQPPAPIESFDRFYTADEIIPFETEEDL